MKIVFSGTNISIRLNKLTIANENGKCVIFQSLHLFSATSKYFLGTTFPHSCLFLCPVVPVGKRKPGRPRTLYLKYVQDLLGDSDGMLQPNNFSSLAQYKIAVVGEILWSPAPQPNDGNDDVVPHHSLVTTKAVGLLHYTSFTHIKKNYESNKMYMTCPNASKKLACQASMSTHTNVLQLCLLISAKSQN